MDHDYRCRKLDVEAQKAEMQRDYHRRQEDAERQKAYQTRQQPQPERSNNPIKLKLTDGDRVIEFEGHPDDADRFFDFKGKHQHIKGPPA